ncbi:MAG: hypothetical protein ABJC63_08335, partial [Gemmatimonadales bacterium]
MTIPDLALFRRAGSHHSSFGTSEELRSTLQRRLYAFGWVIVSYNVLVALFGMLSPDLRARSASAPISIGSLFSYALLALLFAVATYLVRSRTPRTLTFLRIYEAIVFSAVAVMILALNIWDHSTLRGIYEKAPLDIA